MTGFEHPAIAPSAPPNYVPRPVLVEGCQGGQRCSYRTHYLRRGPAHLDHATYHQKEARLLHLCHEAMAWDARHPSQPYPVQRVLDRLAEEVRA